MGGDKYSEGTPASSPQPSDPTKPSAVPGVPTKPEEKEIETPVQD